MGSALPPQIIDGRCGQCGLCILACAEHVLEMGRDRVQVAHPEDCGGCALCEDVCPDDAVVCEFAIVWEDK